MQVQTINLSIPKALLQALDSQAKSEARTRSGLIQEAIRAYLVRRATWENIFQYAEDKALKAKVKPKDLEKIIDNYRAVR